MKKTVLINGRTVNVSAVTENETVTSNTPGVGLKKDGVYCYSGRFTKDKTFSINRNTLHMGRGSVTISTNKPNEITPSEAKIIASKLFSSDVTV